MKKLFKKIALSLSLLISMTSVTAFANTRVPQEPLVLTEELIQKIEPYVKTQGNEFILTGEGYRYLSSEEINLAKTYILASNENLKNIPAEILISNGNTFKVSLDELNKTVDKPMTRATFPSNDGFGGVRYAYYEATWYGGRIFFSSKAIDDINNFVGYKDFITGWAAVAGAQGFLAKIGIKLSSSVLGPIALYTGSVFWAMDKLDKGRGVYLELWLYVPAKISAL